MSYKRDYLSYSALKSFERSPNHYIQYVSGGKEEKSSALVMGSATHTHILEPHKFEERYHVGQKLNMRFNESKDWLKAINELGKEYIADQDFGRIEFMRESVMNNDWASKLTHGLQPLYEKDVHGEINGVLFKGIIDIEGGSYIADLKTCRDASPVQFSKDADSFGYHLQAAIYTHLTGKEFYWIAVESEAPFNCAVYWQDDEDREKATEYLYHLIQKFKDWDGEPHRHPYGEEVIRLNLPPWSRIERYVNKMDKPM